MDAFINFMAFCFSPANILYTVLFSFALLYWITVILGVLDLDLFDFDMDTDLDVDVNTDIDVDADIDTHMNTGTSITGVFHSLLLFFNLGQVPIMIIFTFLTMFMLSASVMFQYYIGHNSLLWGAALLVPNFIGSMLLTKIATQPFRGVFKRLEDEKEDYEELVGRTCVVTTSKVDREFGQAEIDTGGAPLVINAKTKDNQVILIGEEAIVLNYDIKSSTAIIHRL